MDDLRTLRTKRLIVEAFIGLRATAGAGGSSVAETCRRAGVNRATFYRHFEDGGDLADRGIDFLLAELGRAIDAARPEGDTAISRVEARVAAFFEAMRAGRSTLGPLFSGAAGKDLHDKAEAFVETYLLERRLAELDPSSLGLPPDLAARALASTCLGFLAWYLEEERNLRPEKLAALYLGFIGRGLFAKADWV